MFDSRGWKRKFSSFFNSREDGRCIEITICTEAKVEEISLQREQKDYKNVQLWNQILQIIVESFRIIIYSENIFGEELVTRKNGEILKIFRVRRSDKMKKNEGKIVILRIGNYFP